MPRHTGALRFRLMKQSQNLDIHRRSSAHRAMCLLTAVVLVAVACSSEGGGDELTADTTTTAVPETTVADETHDTTTTDAETTTTVPLVDPVVGPGGAQESDDLDNATTTTHAADGHTHDDEPVQPPDDPAPVVTVHAEPEYVDPDTPSVEGQPVELPDPEQTAGLGDPNDASTFPNYVEGMWPKRVGEMAPDDGFWRVPPSTSVTVAFSDWCFFEVAASLTGGTAAGVGASVCRQGLKGMAQPLKWFGASDSCLDSEYRSSVVNRIENPGSVSVNGWWNCPTIYDPAPNVDKTLVQRCLDMPLPFEPTGWPCDVWAQEVLSQPGPDFEIVACRYSFVLAVRWFSIVDPPNAKLATDGLICR